VLWFEEMAPKITRRLSFGGHPKYGLHKHKKWPKIFSGKFEEIRAKILRTPKNLPAPTTMDERLNPWKPKISCKPVQNFVRCSHLNLPPFLCPHNCCALFDVRASSFIVCRPTKLSLCFASLRLLWRLCSITCSLRKTLITLRTKQVTELSVLAVRSNARKKVTQAKYL